MKQSCLPLLHKTQLHLHLQDNETISLTPTAENTIVFTFARQWNNLACPYCTKHNCIYICKAMKQSWLPLLHKTQLYLYLQGNETILIAPTAQNTIVFTFARQWNNLDCPYCTKHNCIYICKAMKQSWLPLLHKTQLYLHLQDNETISLAPTAQNTIVFTFARQWNNLDCPYCTKHNCIYICKAMKLSWLPLLHKTQLYLHLQGNETILIAPTAQNTIVFTFARQWNNIACPYCTKHNCIYICKAMKQSWLPLLHKTQLYLHLQGNETMLIYPYCTKHNCIYICKAMKQSWLPLLHKTQLHLHLQDNETISLAPTAQNTIVFTFAREWHNIACPYCTKHNCIYICKAMKLSWLPLLHKTQLYLHLQDNETISLAPTAQNTIVFTFARQWKQSWLPLLHKTQLYLHLQGNETMLIAPTAQNTIVFTFARQWNNLDCPYCTKHNCIYICKTMKQYRLPLLHKTQLYLHLQENDTILLAPTAQNTIVFTFVRQWNYLDCPYCTKHNCIYICKAMKQSWLPLLHKTQLYLHLQDNETISLAPTAQNTIVFTFARQWNNLDCPYCTKHNCIYICKAMKQCWLPLLHKTQLYLHLQGNETILIAPTAQNTIAFTFARQWNNIACPYCTKHNCIYICKRMTQYCLPLLQKNRTQTNR